MIRPTLTALALLLLTACRRAAPPTPEPVAGPRIEKAELGLAISQLPAGMSALPSTGPELLLSAPGSTAGGTIRIQAGPPQTGGINLVEEVRRAQAEFEAKPEGRFLGSREIVAPIGNALWARGHWREGESEREEIRIFALHPGENRLLTIVSTFTAGDAATSRERLDQILTLVGELEALASASPPVS